MVSQEPVTMDIEQPPPKWSPEDWMVIRRARGRCEYCGLDGLSDFNVWRQFQIDHIVSRSRGGGDGTENKANSCIRCNMVKAQWDTRSELQRQGLDPDHMTRDELVHAVSRELLSWNDHVRADFLQMRALAALDEARRASS